MKIIYLYAEIMPYQIVVFKELSKSYNAEIIAVHWDKKKKTPFQLSGINHTNFVPRSKFETKEKLLQFVEAENPTLIVCSGWMDSFYNYVAKRMKKKGIIIVATSDTQWKGGRQWLNVLLSRFRQKQWFSYMWVAGSYQYEYACKLGFTKENIIFNALTADVDLYRKYGIENIATSKNLHNFVFIGRFTKVKGISVMIEAFKQLKKEFLNDWKLICIGSGEQEILLGNVEDVEVLKFRTQEEICSISNNFGVLLLPSTAEPWGLVTHEATCLGLPLLISNICGAKSLFLLEGYNGYSFAPNSVSELKKMMKQMMLLPDEQLIKMKQNSYNLSSRITPAISAASLMSTLMR